MQWMLKNIAREVNDGTTKGIGLWLHGTANKHVGLQALIRFFSGKMFKRSKVSDVSPATSPKTAGLIELET